MYVSLLCNVACAYALQPNEEIVLNDCEDSDSGVYDDLVRSIVKYSQVCTSVCTSLCVLMCMF